MKRQVIQNVLNLPGISGMALIDGRNRPFFFGPDISLNTQQQDALVQGIQQVVDTTPAHFQTFSFRFVNQLAHIYKLGQGLILLVLITDQMSLTDYGSAIDELKITLMEAPHNAVPTFRLMAGCVTLGSGSVAPAAAEANPAASQPLVDSAAGGMAPTGPAIAAALTHLSDGAAQYLGKTLVVNTWKQSRPAHPWLEQFELQPDGHFTVRVDDQTPVTPEQHQWVKDWVTAFLGRGGRTIRNFQTLVSSQTLTPAESRLLLENPPSESL